jgi:hypothetical protein
MTGLKYSAIAVLATWWLLGAAAAQVGRGSPRCERDYKEFWSKMSTGVASKLSGAQLAQLNRYALRGYDGCTSGDGRFTADNFFKKLEAIDPSRADEFLRNIEANLPKR